MTESLSIPACASIRTIDPSIWSALKTSIFPGASDESIALAYDYCKARKLDILKKPCHIVGMSVKNAQTQKYEWRNVIMPSIAEARITAHRTGEYAGQDAPVFGEIIPIKIGEETHLAPEFCTVTVYRMIHGQRMACLHTEFFDEACGVTKDGDLNSMWRKRKRGQLAKCAEAGALRKAFPEEMGGIITADELEGQENEPRNVTPAPSRLRSAPIEPFTPLETPNIPKRREIEPESPAPKEEKLLTIPATGRQTKTRENRIAIFENITERSGNGKTFWVVALKIGEVAVEMTTFSQTMHKSLMDCEIGSKLWITFTKNEKGYALEDYTLQVEEEEEGLV